jgi:hypothetical protein
MPGQPQRHHQAHKSADRGQNPAVPLIAGS